MTKIIEKKVELNRVDENNNCERMMVIKSNWRTMKVQMDLPKVGSKWEEKPTIQ